jgi:hypothetical protein
MKAVQDVGRRKSALLLGISRPDADLNRAA